MNIAVLLYQNTSNPAGIPGEWPAQTATWNNQPPPWIEMTPQEFINYKALHKSAYDTWKNTFEYDNSYLEKRERAYPGIKDTLDAVVQMAKALYPVPGTMPPLMQSIVDKRNAVDQEYPPPA